MTSFLLTAALLVFVGFSATYAQQIFPVVLEGRVGDSVMFGCISTELNEAVNNVLEIYRPELDAFVRAEDLPRVNRMNDQNNPSLTNYTFGPLTSADNGVILHCTSGSDTGNATISVIFAPMISGEAVDPIDEGMNLTVPLTVLANPVPMYAWTRDGAPVTNGNGITVSLKSIAFKPVSRQHDGLYKIVATNSAGMDSFNFTLDVRYQSQFESEFVLPNNFNCIDMGTVIQCAANEMESVTLVCDAVGNPAPTVTINHPSLVNPTTDSRFMIASAAPEDAGMYTCTARNQGFSPVQRVFQLYVGGVPVPVSRVDVEFRGDFVVFNWTYNNSVNGVPATEYVVTVLRVGTDLVSATRTIPISQMNSNVSLGELPSFRNHTVRVVVRNMQGDSPVISNLFRTPGSGSVGNCASLIMLSLMLVITSVLLY